MNKQEFTRMQQPQRAQLHSADDSGTAAGAPAAAATTTTTAAAAASSIAAAFDADSGAERH